MDTTDQQAIQLMEDALRAATLHNDAVTTGELLAEDWRNISVDGSIINKTQLLAVVDTFRFVSITDSEVEIRIYDACAIVTGGSLRVLEDATGGEVRRNVRFTRVYVRQQERWRVVSAQATTIPDE
jgi:hypothetical protein